MIGGGPTRTGGPETPGGNKAALRRATFGEGKARQGKDRPALFGGQTISDAHESREIVEAARSRVSGAQTVRRAGR